jgi:hypothetical protein
MSLPTFGELADDFVSFHPPLTPECREALENVRAAFKDMIEGIEHLVPDGPDATLAARKVHDACQACIFAVVHNQS